MCSVVWRSGQRYVVLTKSFPAFIVCVCVWEKEKEPWTSHCVLAHSTQSCCVFLENRWWKRVSGNLQRTHLHACVFTGSLVQWDNCRKSCKWHLVADTILTLLALFLGCPIPPINFSEGPPRPPESPQQRKKKTEEKNPRLHSICKKQVRVNSLLITAWACFPWRNILWPLNWHHWR